MLNKFIPAVILLMLANAACADAAIGPYVGVGLGGSFRDYDSLATSASHTDKRAAAQKIYAGYRITPHWGAEVGYANLGKIENTYTAGTFKGRAEAFYVAGTGRLPLNDRFALTAKLAFAYGRTTASRSNAALDELKGSKNNLTLGSIGAEYAFTPNLVGSLDLDRYGSVSKKTEASMLSANLHYHF